MSSQSGPSAAPQVRHAAQAASHARLAIETGMRESSVLARTSFAT